MVTPSVFGMLGFRVLGHSPVGSYSSLAPQYLTIFMLALGLFLAVVIAGRQLASVLTSDLRQLQLFARDLVRDGLTRERARTVGTEEVASLSVSINQMLDRLYEQRQALTREGEKLMTLAEALKCADKRKDEFVAMLAHELRSPLAPIMKGANLLQTASEDDATIEHAGKVISKHAKHMTRIIDDLLDITRISRGHVTIRLETLDFRQVIEDAMEEVQPLIESYGHQLYVDIPAHPLPVKGDHDRLVQVASNLLNNAVKFTPPGGRLDLAVVIEKNELLMTLADNGDGIDPELMPDLFDLFSQGERSVDRRLGGLGLGLALVKSLVQMHGGYASASSQGLGKGSIFSICLPCAPASGEAPPSDQALESRAAIF